MWAEDGMTAEDWSLAATCDEASWMIRTVWGHTGPRSARKSQLFACACARQVWHLFEDDQLRRAIEVAERYADGVAARPEALAAADQARASHRATEPNAPARWLVNLVGVAAHPRDQRFEDWKAPWSYRLLPHADKALPARLARDIFGTLPFGRPEFTPSSVTPGVALVALAAYSERHLPSGHLDNARLAVLSDGLEEAGCTDLELLSHLRSPGPHVRGCWALDLVLGKE